ncbi:MAG: TlpA disulfide reductase family protein [Candidatus Limnocylindrales bacterium]
MTALAIVVVAAVALIAITRPIAPAPGSPTPLDPVATQYVIGPATEGLKVGDRAPELALTRSDGSAAALTDLDGKPIRLADLRGHPVWIDFWASWCPPCQAETPVLRDMYASYKDRGLVLIAISVQETDAADVRAYATRYGLPYTVAADLTGDVFRRYRIYGLPTQFFLDGEGVIRSVVQGPVDYDAAAADLALIVPGSAPSGSAAGASPAASSPP